MARYLTGDWYTEPRGKDKLQESDTYMRIEQQNDKECVPHWGVLYKITNFKI